MVDKLIVVGDEKLLPKEYVRRYGIAGCNKVVDAMNPEILLGADPNSKLIGIELIEAYFANGGKNILLTLTK
jgi:hypothetical protein